jgi:hypothetical protein
LCGIKIQGKINMQTKIDLCSQALLKIGEQPITNFSDENVSSRIAAGLYDLTIDALLCRHTWDFATKKYIVAPESDNYFIIPSDVLRIISCSSKDYEIIGNKIKCNSDNLEITAISRIDAEYFPAYFSSLAITKLAMEFCIPLTGNQNTFAILNALFENELNSAKFIDSFSTQNTAIKEFSLLSARF